MKRIIAIAMVVLMTLALFAGCTTSNQTAAQPEETAAQQEAAAPDEAAATADAANAAAETYDMQPMKITDHTLKVALIPVTINTSYTMTINGAKEHIKTMGYDMDLTVEAPSGNTSSIEEQGNIIENMIQQGVDAIALATESDVSMLPYLREAAAAGIPVFFFNMTELDDSDIYYVSSIGYDQYEAGKNIGSWIAENYKDKETKIAVLEGYPGVVNDERMRGFNDAIAGSSNISIVASQCANWTRADGQSVTESLLTANPDITLLYGPYDEMVLGGLVAIKERNLLGQIDVVGYGATEDAIHAIRNGEMVATVDAMEYYTGYDIVDAIYQYCVLGQQVKKVINRPTVVYDKTNVDTHDDNVYAK